jgi:CRP/FNR family transcriptional regulator, cyclic AMP receptor protein
MVVAKSLEAGPVYRGKVADMLGQVHLLDDLSGQELEQLARYMTVLQVGPGYVLFEEGGPNEAMWFLVEGRVEIIKQTLGAKSCRLTTVTPGKSLGEMSVIDGQPYSATGRTLTDSLLLQITKEGFERVCEATPKLGNKLLLRLARLMSMRLRQTSGALVQLVDG